MKNIKEVNYNMNNTKLALLLTLPVLALGATTLSNNQVFAQSSIQTAEVKQTPRGTMMGVSDQSDRVDMMKSHHGDNWKEDCTKMMEQVEASST
jgi:hypothetical protein